MRIWLVVLATLLFLFSACEQAERATVKPGKYKAEGTFNALELDSDGHFRMLLSKEKCPSLEYQGKWAFSMLELQMTHLQTKSFEKCDTTKHSDGQRSELTLDVRNINEQGFETYSAAKPDKPGLHWVRIN